MPRTNDRVLRSLQYLLFCSFFICACVFILSCATPYTPKKMRPVPSPYYDPQYLNKKNTKGTKLENFFFAYYLPNRLHAAPFDDATGGNGKSTTSSTLQCSTAELNARILKNLYGEEYAQVELRRNALPERPRTESPPVGKSVPIPKSLTALCLSGGGIRSASFNLGVLQALHELRILNRIDYLSSVSGGSYIAGWYMTHSGMSDDVLFSPSSLEMRHILSNGNYLTSSHASRGMSGMIGRVCLHGLTLPVHWFCNELFDWDVSTPGCLRSAYRQGLKRAFLAKYPIIKSDARGRNRLAWDDPSSYSLRDLLPSKLIERNTTATRPFWIANAGLGLKADRTYFRNQFGDNFEMTPLYCGADAIGYVSSDPGAKWMRIPTVIAASGAAVSYTDIRISSRLTPLIHFFNLDLGYYIGGWYPEKEWSSKISWKRIWFGVSSFFPINFVSESVFGWETGHDRTVFSRRHLISDGGGFENLGVLSAVRRGCRYIIVCDAAADPKYLQKDSFHSKQTEGQMYYDLRRLALRLRNELGAELKIDIASEEETCPVTSGTINNLPVTGSGADKVTLIYIKPTFNPVRDASKYPIYIEGYRATCPKGDYPQETTADQFFNETQLTAYRELGYQTVMQNQDKIVLPRR